MAYKKCEACGGSGEVLVSHARQAYSPSRGTYIEDEEWDECEVCHGSGEVEDDGTEEE